MGRCSTETGAAPLDVRRRLALAAAIIFALVGDLVPMVLKAVRKGGRVVCGGIHRGDILTFP